MSAAGVLRGIHFSDVPPGQAKYVTCVRGAVLDVAVDIRVGSPTFGQWDSVLLDDVDRRQVYLAEGLGHALHVAGRRHDGRLPVLDRVRARPRARHRPARPGDRHRLADDTGRDGTPLTPLLSDKDRRRRRWPRPRPPACSPASTSTQRYVDELPA